MKRIERYFPAFFCLPPGHQGTEACDFRGLVYLVIYYIEQTIVVIFALALITFLWGVFRYTLLAQGDEKQTAEAKNVIFYGIIGLFVMVSVWGILKIIQKSFFG